MEKDNTTFHLLRADTAAMRGVAILAIVLHNFTHWLRPMVKENEYTFDIHNVRRMMVELSFPTGDIFAHLVSYLGHYGVPVFVFLSAFGLVKKYEELTPTLPNGGGAGERNEVSAWVFIRNHWLKLFTMMVVGYSAFVLVDYMTPGPRHYHFWNVVGQLGMFSNLYADPDHAIWPGPYWYFGLTLQLYLVYRFVLYPGKGSLAGVIPALRNGWVLALMALLFLGVQLLFDPRGDELNWYRYNCMGNMPVFIAGLMFTRKDIDFKQPTKLMYALMSLVLLACILSLGMHFSTWTIVPFFVVIATVCIVKAMPSVVLGAFAWVGAISSFMFVCHPITRKILIPIAHRGDVYAGLLLYIVATIILAIVFKMLIKKISEA